MDHDTYFYRYGEAHPDDLARWCAEPEPQQPEPEQPEPEPTLEDLRDVIRREFARANANFYRALRAEAERDALAEQVAGCRKALGLACDTISDLTPDWFTDSHPDYVGDMVDWFLAAATGVPVAHLTGEKEAANHE
jgi:hypothetical protein